MNYVEKMLIEQLSDVLTCIISHLHDPDFAIPKNSILPIPTPFYSNEILIRRTINYFQVSMHKLIRIFLLVLIRPVSENSPFCLFIL